jgi:uncharacterized protein YndB with AHSA1/START domain
MTSAAHGEYRFLTRWQFDAPIDRVWAVITDVGQYPLWWPGVQKATILGPDKSLRVGQTAELAVRGSLPYTLHFRTEVVDFAAPHRLIVRSSGELTGRGEWSLSSSESGTEVTYLWEVTLDKQPFNLLARLPGIRRLLENNHDRVMTQGGANLAQLLEADHAEP